MIMNFPVANIHIHYLTMLLYCKCYVVIVIVCFLVSVQVKYLEFGQECISTKAITIHDRDKPWFNSGI